MSAAEQLNKREREFDFQDRHFQFVKDFLFAKAGISLSDIKRDMVYGRLVRRLRSLNIENFDSYFSLLKDDAHSEITEFINSLTTNLTSFFREAHHFDYLAGTVLPEIMQRKTDRRIRIWSAGCSTGEEPYSIAISVREAVSAAQAWDIKILATDLDTSVVEKGKSGIYSANRISGISEQRKKRWFRKGRGASLGQVKACADIQRLIHFKQLNLMLDWPMKGLFDVIFCRNVVIYFNKQTQRKLFDKFAAKLPIGGYLFVGHSESLHGVTSRFELLGKTVYRRVV